MTDELQTSKLATRIGETLSPVPQVHAEYYGALNQLYPLLLSPLYALLGAPAAFEGAHVLNAFLLASTAWPVYLLGRAVTGTRGGGYFAAALTAFVPWLVLSSTLLTENAAYPAFVWGVLLCYRDVLEPSARRDAAALAGLALVYLARTQLLVLALALPVGVLWHERVPRRAISRHRVLATAYGIAAVAAVVLAAAGLLTHLLGNYASTVQGDVLPDGIWHSAAVHLGAVVVATGVAPFLLATAWSLTSVPRDAFAVLLVTLVPLMTVEAASFDLRFTPGGFVQDRYVCYLAPLFAVGAAACVLEPQRRGLRAALVVAAGLAFVGLATQISFDELITLWWASPAGAFHRALRDAAGEIGLSADDLVRWGGLALAACLAGALWRLPARLSLSVLGVTLMAYGAYQATYVFDRLAVPGTTRPQTIEGVRRDWVDAALPARTSVAVAPSPELAREYWWDAEFWNKTVDRALSVDGREIFTPFAAAPSSVDLTTGQMHGEEPTRYLVVSDAAPQFGFSGAVRLAVAEPLALVRVARPYRIEWLVTGAPDGWARPGKEVRFRVFGGRHELALSLRAPSVPAPPRRFVLRSGCGVRTGQVPPGDTVRRRVPVCRVAMLLVRGGALYLDRLTVRRKAARSACRRGRAALCGATAEPG